MKKPVLALVIPCLNEQELIGSTVETLLGVMRDLSKKDKISKDSFIYLVDDGSTDTTWHIIEAFHKKNNKIKGLKFTRNFGNQSAILAGMLHSGRLGADCVITIDADLQQDENAIEWFIDKYLLGADIVCGIRNSRDTDSFFKRLTALGFYKFMNALGVNIAENHSDFRLVSSKAIEVLSHYKESNLFLRGIFNELGLKTEYVPFDVKPRFVGKSRFKYTALISLAIKGITSFSVIPLRIVSVMGLLISLFSFGFGLWAMVEKYILKTTVQGWTTIIVIVCFIGGMQIFCTGIIGEYLGQIYKEVKARPRYLEDVELK